MMESNGSMKLIHQLLAQESAADVAEVFVSPHIRSDFLCEVLAEEGPPMWVVNRSDVYDETLEALLVHPLENIRSRSAEKLGQRRSSLVTLEPPPPLDPSMVPIYGVEDVLGHPLVEWDHVIFFSRALEDEVRASACLSLTRRLLEYPPRDFGAGKLKERLRRHFESLLLGDPSSFVRSFAARIPLWDPDQISAALEKERHPVVVAKLLQSHGSIPKHFKELLDRAPELAKNPWILMIAALDSRLERQVLEAFLKLAADESQLSEALIRYRFGRSLNPSPTT